MLTVKERDNDYTEAALKELNGTLGENERVLIMTTTVVPLVFRCLRLTERTCLSDKCM